ncbi:MAG: nucleotidyltransferase domain-containing protein [Rhodocyclaceae bacterium]|nr:nucleotidyltransferase domain-containing protein [Rhodocyclaceae bacterium]
MNAMPTRNWSSAYADIVAALPEAAQHAYGDRLIALVLFGSVARGTMRPDSDIDLLLIARDLPLTRLARNAEFEAVDALLAGELAAAAMQGVHTTLSPLIRTPEELERGSFAFLDIPAEGRILYDPRGVAADYFARLSARLAAQGAERRYCNGAPYWLLKPSARPGEPIPL